ncbi:hypothetical protein MNB_SV-14-714 [hydrothermal vent metagenome]|uniref:Uncharacterized protein n=1 Tax=hydrothermal vent metagenome TaxID=652676 RepID=A0A1W1BTW3_9ZZZZ
MAIPSCSFLKYKQAFPFFSICPSSSKLTPHLRAKPSPALVTAPSRKATINGGPKNSILLSACFKAIESCFKTRRRGVYINSNSEVKRYSSKIFFHDFSIFFIILSSGIAGSSSTPISIRSDFVILCYPIDN